MGRETMSSTGRMRNSECGIRNISVHSARRTPHSALKCGFTLVEILVVIAIIGVILSTSLPALSGYAGQMRLKTTARELRGLFSLARSSAITSRSSRTVAIDPEKGEAVIEETLQEEEPRRVRLHSSLRVEVQVSGQEGAASGPVQVTFQPSGSLLGRSVSVTLSNGSRTQTIAITGVTGAMSLQAGVADSS